jgi:hypothetical protein
LYWNGPTAAWAAWNGSFGNWCSRLVAPGGHFSLGTDAIFEAYLGGRWHTFDPRNNAPRIGRVLIAQGRDAADVPLTHTFGPATLSGFRVWADEVPPE